MPDEEENQPLTLPNKLDQQFKDDIAAFCITRMPSREGPKHGKTTPFFPNQDQIASVFMMMAHGMTEDKICLCINNPNTGKPITKKTFDKYFKPIKEIAKDYATHMVAKSLFHRAINTDGQVNEAVAQRAAEFWLKTQAHWKTTDVIEHNHEHKLDEETSNALQILGQLAKSRFKSITNTGNDGDNDPASTARIVENVEVSSASESDSS